MYTASQGGMLLCAALPPTLADATIAVLPVYAKPLPGEPSVPVHFGHSTLCAWLGISFTVSLWAASPPVFPTL
jgi:hypothetical protein